MFSKSTEKPVLFNIPVRITDYYNCNSYPVTLFYVDIRDRAQLNEVKWFLRRSGCSKKWANSNCELLERGTVMSWDWCEDYRFEAVESATMNESEKRVIK